MVFVIRFVFFVILSLCIWGGERYYSATVLEPQQRDAAILQVNGGDQAQASLQLIHQKETVIEIAAIAATIIALLGCFATIRPRPMNVYNDYRTVAKEKA